MLDSHRALKGAFCARERKDQSMQRINIGNGRWFDKDSAECFGEATQWDGRNHVSLATGSQWDHECLFKTTGGTWILHRWSQWQGSTPTYRVINEEIAHTWLLNNDHDVPDHVMQAAQL